MILLFLFLSIFSVSCVSAPLTSFDAATPVLERGYKPTKVWQVVRSGKLSDDKYLKECSGLATIDPSIFSIEGKNFLLAHNDSFSNKKIFGFQVNANSILHYCTINLASKVINFDWEDMVSIDQGRVLIGDCGDNWRIRRFMDLYLLDFNKEPLNPAVTKLQVRFPGKPSEQKNFDCEAIFKKGDDLYFLTKEYNATRIYSVSFTKLMEAKGPKKEELKYIGSLKLNGRVTAADYHSESGELLILTYDALHIFQDKLAHTSKPISPSNLESLSILRLPKNNGWEAACFISNTQVIVSNESGYYKIFALMENP